MADLERGVKIHELTTAPTVSSSDYVAIDDGDNTYKVSIANLNTTGATTASHYADLAAESATTAQSAATTATTAAQSASSAVTLATSQLQSYVTDAETAASNAAISEANARAYASSDYVKQARSWAVGGTESREGEDTDNSKYYSENAANSAINAATSATDANIENLKAEGYAVGQQNGVDVDSSSTYYHNNAKYYSEIAQGAGAGGVNSSVIAPAEVTSTVTRTYSVGDQFVYNGVLYKATSSISVGSTIVPGTNCTIADNLVYQIGEKQNIVLASTMTIGGQTITEVEPALHALNNKSGGHIIYDEDDTAYPERSKLKFINCEITDDSTNDTTIVEAEGGGSAVVGILSITTNNSAFYGQTITVSLGGSSVATGTFNNSGTATINVTGAGIYAVSVTAYGATVSENVTVAASQTYNVALNSDTILGAWLDKGGLDYTDYADFAAVEADEKAVRRLMTIHDAVDYLAECASASDSLALSIINSDICAKWINLRDYALDTLYANTYIASMMNTADKYFYGEWVITDSTTTPPTWGAKGNVPVMTANDAPYGVASASSCYSGTGGVILEPYKVFNPNESFWASATNAYTNEYLRYKFTNPVCVKKVRISNAGMTTQTNIIKGSNDGTNWDVLSDTLTIEKNDSTIHEISLNNNNYYLYYEVECTETYTPHQNHVWIETLQFYGRELRESVPVMTSNTAPYGEAFAISNQTNYPPYYSFNGDDSNRWASMPNDAIGAYLGYKFPNPVCVKDVYVKNSSVSVNYMTKFKIQASNDNSTYTDLTGEVDMPASVNSIKIVDLSNDNSYLYYRLVVLAYVGTPGSNGASITALQFYGLNYTEYDWDTDHPRHYLYDHGVEVETLTRMADTASTKIVYEPDQITFSVVSATYDSNVYVYKQIDLTDYDLARVKFGNKFKIGTTRAGVLLAKTSLGGTELGKTNFTSVNADSLDVSSINQECYFSLLDNAYTGNGTTFTITEWWLE